MQIEGTSQQSSTFFPSQAPENEDLGKDAFMQLLVTQLKNQNPLEPTANDEFVAQLANFSELEQMELVNENLLGMVVLQQSNALMDQLTQGSKLIGQDVVYRDEVTGHEASGTVESVKVTDGAAVLVVGGKDVRLGLVTEVTGPGQEG